MEERSTVALLLSSMGPRGDEHHSGGVVDNGGGEVDWEERMNGWTEGYFPRG